MSGYIIWRKIVENNHNFKKLKVHIVRGCPSSGKSTYIKNMIPKLQGDYAICSADDFWYLIDGTYRFDGSRIAEAHRWCYQKFCRAIDKKVQHIFVDNCNIKAKDFKHYIVTAKENGYDVEIHEMKNWWSFDAKECFKRSQQTHNVPLSTIQRMLARYQHNLTVEGVISGKNI